MKRKQFVLAMAAVFVLCLTLVGCGGSGGGGGNPTKTFLGTWDLVAATDTSEEDIELMKAFGIYCYLDLQDEGKAEINLMGEPLEGTWEAKSASECSIAFEGETITATLKGDLLSMEQDGEELSFKKLNDEDAAKLKEEAEGALSSFLGGEDDGDGGDDAPVEEIGQQIASDNICTIEVVNKTTDWAGDSGYTLKITNNTDTAISVSAAWDTFSVGGAMTDPSLSETVKPGAFVETFMWFDSEVAPNIDALVDVSGELEVYDTETYDTIATYPFSM